MSFPLNVNITIFLHRNGLGDIPTNVIEPVSTTTRRLTNSSRSCRLSRFSAEWQTRRNKSYRIGGCVHCVSEVNREKDPESPATIVAINRVPFSPPLCAIRARFIPGYRSSADASRGSPAALPKHRNRDFPIQVGWLNLRRSADRRAETTNRRSFDPAGRTVRDRPRTLSNVTESGREGGWKWKVSSREGDGHPMKTNLFPLSRGGKLRQDFACQREESRCFRPHLHGLLHFRERSFRTFRLHPLLWRLRNVFTPRRSLWQKFDS